MCKIQKSIYKLRLQAHECFQASQSGALLLAVLKTMAHVTCSCNVNQFQLPLEKVCDRGQWWQHARDFQLLLAFKIHKVDYNYLLSMSALLHRNNSQHLYYANASFQSRNAILQSVNFVGIHYLFLFVSIISLVSCFIHCKLSYNILVSIKMEVNGMDHLQLNGLLFDHHCCEVR